MNGLADCICCGLDHQNYRSLYVFEIARFFMDSLKGVQELKSLLVYHSSPFLSHLFDSLDANALKAFELTLNHCRLSDIEAADYRSAYGQLCDWLYGWKLVDGQKDGQVNTKTPRPIDFKNETGNGGALMS